MNIASTRRAQIADSIRSKEARDAFVDAEVATGVPFQIRAIRQSLGWTQKDLGRRAGMAQATICALENPNNPSPSIRTLKKLAAAFDVGLIVRFAPFSELVSYACRMRPSDLTVATYDRDKVLHSTTVNNVIDGPFSNVGSPTIRPKQSPFDFKVA